MSISFFKNIREKHSLLTVIGICLLTVVFNAAAFLFADINDEDIYFDQHRSSFKFVHFKDLHALGKSQDVFSFFTFDSIHDRSPPLI